MGPEVPWSASHTIRLICPVDRHGRHSIINPLLRGLSEYTFLLRSRALDSASSLSSWILRDICRISSDGRSEGVMWRWILGWVGSGIWYSAGEFFSRGGVLLSPIALVQETLI